MSASRNGYIGRAPADSSVIIARKTHEPTGVQTDFTLNSGYTPGYCDVYLNGVKLIDEKDFTATNGSTVGLTSAAQSGDIIELVAYKAFNLGVPVSDITGNLDITGHISASSSITVDNGFYGDGSNLSGVAGAAITQYVSANSLTVLGSPGVSTITRLGATDLNVTGIITANGLSGNVTGAACTFTTGTFNGNVTIGGTLTYEDVTNVDSLGIVTARAGVNISGGELLVGSNIKGGTAGVLTATSFSGSGANLTSLPTQTPTTITVADESSDTTCFPSFFTAATGDLAPKTGTNLTFNSSTGALTATKFVGDGSELTGISGAVAGTTGDFSSNLTVGSGITFGSAGVATFSGTADIHLKDSVQLKIGDASDLALYHNASGNSWMYNGTNGGDLYIGANAGEIYIQTGSSANDTAIKVNSDSSVDLYYNNSKKFETSNDGTVTTGIATATSNIVTTTGRFISNSTSSGDYIRLYASDGTGKWDIYGNGADLRFSDNDSAGVVRFDTDIAIADKIVHYGDTNTAIRFPSADTITAETAGSERLRVTAGGQVGINSSDPDVDLVVSHAGQNTGMGVTVYINSQKNSASHVGSAELRLGFHHSGNNDGKGDAYIKLEEDGGNSFDGNLTIGVPVNSGGGGSTTWDSVKFEGAQTGVDVSLCGTASGISSVTWDASANSLIFKDNSRIKFGDAPDLDIWHDGTASYVQNATGELHLRSNTLKLADYNSSHVYFRGLAGGTSELYFDNSKKFETTNDGTVTTGIATVTQGLNTDGLLSEKFNTTAGKLSDNTNIDLEDGMVHYFSTTESTTSTPNIRYNSSKSLNNMLSTGDAITVTIITTAAAAGYSANVNIDGNGQTEEWVGGSAPSEGGGSGHDIYTYNILKTSNSPAYKVIVNVLNATN
tara:strand:+ start:1486 stop:4176 length:2691 start_codon:yes stop_codon:yes gene_type:complete